MARRLRTIVLGGIALLLVLVFQGCGTFGAASTEGAADAGAERGVETEASSSTGLLSALSLSVGPLTPAFSPATTLYAVGPVPISDVFATSTTVTATTTEEAATLSIASAPARSAAPSAPLVLRVGPNPIDITVTKRDGTISHVTVLVTGVAGRASTYLKASNTRADAAFCTSVALSGDILAVGAIGDSAAANAPPTDTSAPYSGAVYVFLRTGSTWVQQAYLKAPNARANAYFGSSVALDGNTLAVGSLEETSNATGVNGDANDTSAHNAGAVYVFARSGSTWSKQAYLKASNTAPEAFFGRALSLSGNTLAVGADGETSDALGVNGTASGTSTSNAGAVYVFTRTGPTWVHESYLKASNTRAEAHFGASLALSGTTLAVGAYGDSSIATGINGDQADTSISNGGAVYVFVRAGASWAQQAYVKASNTGPNSSFGGAVALSGDTLAVGAAGESSNATGVNGNQADRSMFGAGAGYIFARTGSTWKQEAYLKASNTVLGAFGSAVALSGNVVAFGSTSESSRATGVGGDQADRSLTGAGAAYTFVRAGSAWAPAVYLKASNTRANATFGSALALDGTTLAVGSVGESSHATGVDGDQADTSSPAAGACYVFQ